MTDKSGDWPKRITPLQWRLLACYALFQVINLINMLLAVLLSACLLAFVLALRGQTIGNLLPWFLLMAIPVWLGCSFWTYCMLIRYGILPAKRVVPESPSPTKKQSQETSIKNATPKSAPEPANDDTGLSAAMAPLRRLFSL